MFNLDSTITVLKKILAFGLLMGLLTGCASAAAQPVASPAVEKVAPPTNTPTTVPAPTNTSAVSTPISAPTDTPLPLPTAKPASPTDTPVLPTETVAAEAASGVSFANDLEPIFDKRCLNCHGGEKTQKGLSLLSYKTLMAGSTNGQVVIPGDPDNSVLVQLIEAGKMPKRGPHLLPAEIEKIKAWVAAGTPNN